MLAPEQIERYVENNGMVCLYCGSDDLSGSEINYGNAELTQEVACFGCGRQWIEIYKLVSVKEVSNEVS